MMRRRGIAESLVRAIEEDVVRGFEKDAAEQQRKKKISLEVEEDNDAALGLYTSKLGYEVTHRDADGRKRAICKAAAPHTPMSPARPSPVPIYPMISTRQPRFY